MDIETINLNDKQVPIAISYCYDSIINTDDKPKPVGSDIFLINKELFNSDVDKAVIDLFKRYFDTIEKLEPHTIFVHNLGTFDGYFILKYLSYIYEGDRVSSIIDDSNKFIQISLNINKGKSKDKSNFIKFKDSYRIFPISLNKLGDVFNSGVGKYSKYNLLFNSRPVGRIV